MTARSDRRGFTFVELMIVVTIIGLLASIALNRLVGTRDRAFVTAMRTDLRSLALAQESYFYDHDIYTADMATLVSRGYGVNPGVTIVVNEATVLGWSATATHENTLVRCYIFVGGAAPVGSATREGEASCTT